MPNNNLVALIDIEELNRSRRSVFSVKGDCTVDHCRAHFDFLAVEAHKRLLIRCHVEIARKNSVGRCGGDLRICALHNLSALLAKTQNQLIERVAGFGRHLDSGKALVRSFFADIDLNNFKIRAVGQNLIQHLWQNEGIDNVPA